MSEPGSQRRQQLMRLKNEQLSKDVDEINKELAASTMSLHSKNELLAFIQKDLKNNEDTLAKLKGGLAEFKK